MAAPGGVKLHSFFFSSCSWRVRMALHWKEVQFEERNVDIFKAEEHLRPEFEKLNPAKKVPALEIDGTTLTESMAILRYLEDTRPQPPLQPQSALLRARMWEICETIVSGIQPLQNVGLRRSFSTQAEYETFARRHALAGLRALEQLVRRSRGDYSVQNTLSMADLCLVPQVFNAVFRLKLDVSQFKTVSGLYDKLLQEKLFVDTHPMRVRALHSARENA